MNKRKTRIALLLCLAMLLSMVVGCSSGDSDTDDTIGGSDGADWQSTGMYSNVYSLSDDINVYFLDLDEGYSVYTNAKDSDDEPNHLCDIYLDEEQTQYSWDELTDEIVVEDLDGDGIGEIGLVASDDNILWYQLDLENYSYEFLEATLQE